MRHVMVLFIKFVTSVIVFAISLDLFFNATAVDIISFSLILTAVSYLIGELVVLPQLGNRSATIVDFILTYMTVWIFGNIFLDSYIQIGWGSILAATLITASEVFVHRYFMSVMPDADERDSRNNRFNPRLAFGTEFGEEHDIREDRKPDHKPKDD